jgi:hypothetical protein
VVPDDSSKVDSQDAHVMEVVVEVRWVIGMELGCTLASSSWLVVLLLVVVEWHDCDALSEKMVLLLLLLESSWWW